MPGTLAADLRAATGAMIHLNMIPLSGKIGRYHHPNSKPGRSGCVSTLRLA